MGEPSAGIGHARVMSMIAAPEISAFIIEFVLDHIGAVIPCIFIIIQ